MLLLVGPGIAISYSQENVIVDETGIMRWGASGEEVHGFGCELYSPFAHAYRSAEKLGVDPRKAIDEDVYHFCSLRI